MKKRPLLLVPLCVCLVFLGVRRAFTVVTNLGVIRATPLPRRPSPGGRALAQSFGAMAQQHSLARLFVVRYRWVDMDWGFFYEAQYDRPSGQLTVWGAESAHGQTYDWQMGHQYRNVTDSQLQLLASHHQSLYDLPQYGAIPIQLPKRVK
ncbi:hypothetical protein IAD21_01209 [Abditibacteriota bacterium]|nr:hypothetical protein IAD21_01209 [Abditibacteriota bacterium]